MGFGGSPRLEQYDPLKVKNASKVTPSNCGNAMGLLPVAMHNRIPCFFKAFNVANILSEICFCSYRLVCHQHRKNNFTSFMILPISVSIFKNLMRFFVRFLAIVPCESSLLSFTSLSSHKLPAFSSEIVKSLLICFEFLSFLSNQAAART